MTYKEALNSINLDLNSYNIGITPEMIIERLKYIELENGCEKYEQKMYCVKCLFEDYGVGSFNKRCPQCGWYHSMRYVRIDDDLKSIIALRDNK